MERITFHLFIGKESDGSLPPAPSSLLEPVTSLQPASAAGTKGKWF